MLRAVRLATLVCVGCLPLLATGCRSPGEQDSSTPPPTRASTAAGRAAPRPLPRPIRGVWVARFHWRSADDIRRIMENSAAIGCNTVYFQVRGEGTVGYPSRIEPWWRESGFRDPGFDPLALAVGEAHRRGLRLEAWVNVMPGWKGPKPPPATDPPQLYAAHPEWFLHDEQGRRQPLGDFYVILNPAYAEVRRHIVSVVEEICSRYDVDGIHLDYVRFAWDGVPNAKQRFPRDPTTLDLYRRETGRYPDDDVAAWNHWRANQITRLVGEIRTAVNRTRPRASLTAAVWRNPQLGYNDFLQNSVAWLRAGWVDAVMPMAYTDKLAQFESDIGMYRRMAPDRRVVPGVGLYTHKSTDATRGQMERTLGWGGDYALYSYESLFATSAAPARTAAAQREERLRAQRRELIRGMIGAAR